MERFNETVLKIVRIARLEKRDFKTAVSDFLFQYRTTPHTITGISPAELLMGRKMRTKLPNVRIESTERVESDWQKQYAGERRAATTTAIEEGIKVLLEQRRETKLSTHFEPNPYRVIEKDGNAIVIQDAQGQTKLRNVGHMKTFVEADPVAMSGASQGETANYPSETVTETELSLTPNPVTSVTPCPVKLSMDGPRASRQKSAPKWL